MRDGTSKPYVYRDENQAAVTTGLTSASPQLTTNMKTAVSLLVVFAIAIVLAFSITIATGTTEMRLLASGVVAPITALNLVFIY